MLFLRWLLNAGALFVIAALIPGIEISGFYAALLTIVVLGLVNAIIRPLLILLTLPVTILTLGLFTLVINAILFWFVSSIVKGFDVAGFVPAFLGALAMSISSWIISSIFKK